MSELNKGSFQEILVDQDKSQDVKKVKKVVMCTGKIYYDVLKYKEEKNSGIKDVVLIRLEQLYPLPLKKLRRLKTMYNKARWIWLQEEPFNMGARAHISTFLADFNVTFIARATFVCVNPRANLLIRNLEPR